MEFVAKNYLLGMDLGTTNIKAIIMDEKGNVAASASAANHLIFPGTNMVEQMPVNGGKMLSQFFARLPPKQVLRSFPESVESLSVPRP